MSATLASRRSGRLQPLEVLLESPGLPRFELPDELATHYGGALGFSQPRLYANFVASLDGVTAIPTLPESSHLLAAGSKHDRFVMGLLRACADAVLIGAGTLHGSPRTHWTAEHAYPPVAELYAELRRRRDRPPQPTLAVLSGSGRIDPQHPGLSERTLVLTSEQGAAQLGRRLPSSATIVPIGDDSPLDPLVAIETLRAGGHELILCEGGPTLFGALVKAGLVDELFLTLSPQLAGQPAGQRRLSLLEQAELLPGQNVAGRLLSLRQTGSHLFLRYELARTEREKR
jgi:riboflavin biosynthesis pyrimidine reductase